MESMYYTGLDVHKRKISYCVKGSSGKVHIELTSSHFDFTSLSHRWATLLRDEACCSLL
jgi:hypothetical protein